MSGMTIFTGYKCTCTSNRDTAGSAWSEVATSIHFANLHITRAVLINGQSTTDTDGSLAVATTEHLVDGTTFNGGIGRTNTITVTGRSIGTVLVAHVSRRTTFTVTTSKDAINITAINGHIGIGNCSSITASKDVLDTCSTTADSHCGIIARRSRVEVRQVTTSINSLQSVCLGTSFTIYYRCSRTIYHHLNSALRCTILIITTEHIAGCSAFYSHRYRTVNVGCNFGICSVVTQATTIEVSMKRSAIEVDIGDST